MTDGTVLSTHVQTAGRPFPAAGIRARTESGPAPEIGPSTSRNEKAADPVVPQRTPFLSTESQIAAQQAGGQADTASSDPADRSAKKDAEKSAVTDPSNPENLSDEDQKKVEELQRRDREVRAHEQAHKAAGGSLTGSPSFKTERGPDGKSYAVSGEVKIDTSPVPNNPEATIRKLEQVKRAALAPANPSGQDRRVAAAADSKIQAARQEKREKETEELKKANEKKGGDTADLTDPKSPIDNSADSNPLAPPSVVPAAGGGTSPAVRPGSLFNLVA
jgi:SprA-related family